MALETVTSLGNCFYVHLYFKQIHWVMGFSSPICPTYSSQAELKPFQICPSSWAELKPSPNLSQIPGWFPNLSQLSGWAKALSKPVPSVQHTQPHAAFQSISRKTHTPSWMFSLPSGLVPSSDHSSRNWQTAGDDVEVQSEQTRESRNLYSIMRLLLHISELWNFF